MVVTACGRYFYRVLPYHTSQTLSLVFVHVLLNIPLRLLFALGMTLISIHELPIVKLSPLCSRIHTFWDFVVILPSLFAMPSSVVSGVGFGVHIVPFFVVFVAQDDLITFWKCGERLLRLKQDN
ncbi:hypothetical protein VNO80_19668 [Phaseolus coccineus]|uniref:Uncharacterized protein n=1 Tax=Phaseolus coccineus TaxID=3886 RepID=A0AAN9MGK3_PHACN